MDTDHPDDRKAQRLRWEADRLEVVADAQDHVPELQAANRHAARLLRAAAGALCGHLGGAS